MRQKALLIHERKLVLSDGFLVQIRIWQLPEATAERPHGLKYSLFFGRKGERIVGYYNEAGKGDHRHDRDREEPYLFISLEELVADFERDVRRELAP